MSDGPLMDLGHGVTVSLRTCECTDPTCDHTTPLGMTFHHNNALGQPCQAGAWIYFTRPHGWTLERLEPLTVSPSLQCGLCGKHGVIRDGRWMPA